MGLYDDDDAAVTGGDISNGDYWWSKCFSIGLDEALKTKQPEGAIKNYLPKAISRYDAVLKTYPAHAEVKQWKEKAEKIQGKISKDAGYADWKSDFPYGAGQSTCDSFLKGWVNIQWARFAKEKGDWTAAYEQSRAATNNLGTTEAQRGMKKWPEETQKWILDGHKDAEAIWAIAKTKK